jgi:hypothetical protein
MGAGSVLIAILSALLLPVESVEKRWIHLVCPEPDVLPIITACLQGEPGKSENRRHKIHSKKSYKRLAGTRCAYISAKSRKSSPAPRSWHLTMA